MHVVGAVAEGEPAVHHRVPAEGLRGRGGAG
jgi:hypothetical protein